MNNGRTDRQQNQQTSAYGVHFEVAGSIQISASREDSSQGTSTRQCERELQQPRLSTVEEIKTHFPHREQTRLLAHDLTLG